MDYRKQIKRHEGFRSIVYEDTEGIPTVGWGHAFLGPRLPAIGTEFPTWRCVEWFEDDMQDVERDYCFLEKEYGIAGLDFIRRAVLKNMLFNLGLPKLRRFKRMWAAISKSDYLEASKEMLDSRWAKQVKNRAHTLADMMRFGREHHLAMIA